MTSKKRLIYIVYRTCVEDKMDEGIIILSAFLMQMKSVSLYLGGDEETLVARRLVIFATCIFLNSFIIISMISHIIDPCDLAISRTT